MWYLMKNGERTSYARTEAEAKSDVELLNERTDDTWDMLYVDDEEVDAIYLLTDLRERFLDYDLDMFDISTATCHDYARLLELAIDIVKNYHERRYLI